jgi:hypothetical protein
MPPTYVATIGKIVMSVVVTKLTEAIIGDVFTGITEKDVPGGRMWTANIRSPFGEKDVVITMTMGSRTIK